MTDKSGLTHINEQGAAHMVDVGGKTPTRRVAVAAGEIHMKPETLAAILSGNAAKGDVLATARIAGIMAAKKTGDLIPLCHPLALDNVTIDIDEGEGFTGLAITATAALTGKTGVEMEALAAASIACLTVYDMAKAVQKDMLVTNIRLLSKTGGKSGDWVRP